MSDDKCKGCQWHNKPYWSIINPCDNCPRENTNVEIITRWQDPTIEELKTQLQQKENIIKELNEKIEDNKMIIEGNQGCIDNLRKDYNLQKNIIKEVREYLEAKEKDDNNWIDYELLIEPIKIKEILDKID